MKIDENKLNIIKEESLNNHVPIIMDETLNYIKNYVLDNNIKINKILEIGTATGYSAINFSLFLDENLDVKIDTIERNSSRYNQAVKNVKEMGLDKYINIIHDDALNVLENIDEKYDMIFIDAAKSKYPIFLDYCLKYLNNNGVIFADNVLFKGYVLSDYNEHKQRTAVRHLREFLKKLEDNNEIDSKVLNIGDGIGVIRWKI